MTVAVPISHRYTLSVVDGVKQLNRRRLPTRARLASNRKQDRATKNNSSYIDEHAMIATPTRLNTLRQSYSRRGVPTITPPPAIADKAPVHEVSKISLAGAKRRYVELDVPSDCVYTSDSSNSCESSTSSSTTYGACERLGKSASYVKYVQFASHCAVVEIPHFREYSCNQKAAMWNGSKKIRIMAKKNTVEFHHDGWNIDTVAEEDQFVVVDGIPVHPAHAHSLTQKSR
jgi:hypothetical protein